MRKAAAILICLMLLLAFGVAYNQCAQKQCNKQDCPTPCPGNCPTGVAANCSTCPHASGSCPMKGDCATCDGDNCPLKGSAAVKTMSGAVRYVVATNSIVKVQAGEQGLRLRVNPKCAAAEAMRQKLSALTKGEQVTAKYWTCPQSGKTYLVDISASASTAAAPAPAPMAPGCGGTCPMTGGCGGQ